MYDVCCNSCAGEFRFSPAAVWTSPGTIHGPQDGVPASIVIQCPNCHQWTRVELPGDIRLGTPPSWSTREIQSAKDARRMFR
jgi:hypothetical protein